MTDGLSEAYEIKQWDVFTENNELLLENDQLKAENARLRKIAREQRECIAYGNECDGCPHRIPAGGCDASFWDEYNSIIPLDEEEDNNG